MRIQDIAVLERRYTTVSRQIKEKALAMLYERQKAARDAKIQGALDPRYAIPHLVLDWFEVVEEDLTVEVHFKYTGSLSGEEMVVLQQEDLNDILDWVSLSS